VAQERPTEAEVTPAAVPLGTGASPGASGDAATAEVTPRGAATGPAEVTPRGTAAGPAEGQGAPAPTTAAAEGGLTEGELSLLRLVDELAGVLAAGDLAELEVAAGGTTLVLRRPEALGGSPTDLAPSGRRQREGARGREQEGAAAGRHPEGAAGWRQEGAATGRQQQAVAGRQQGTAPAQGAPVNAPAGAGPSGAAPGGRDPAAPSTAGAAAAGTAPAGAAPAGTAPRGATPSTAGTAPAQTTRMVLAPLTGIWYASPAPGADPYVAAGGEVAVGQVIGLIEAMKLFNEIKSDVAGRVVRVLVESGQLVRAKQPLIEVEPW
jgi:acetyl-CoA carboxylase biotin carboxyl carrier protein